MDGLTLSIDQKLICGFTDDCIGHDRILEKGCIFTDGLIQKTMPMVMESYKPSIQEAIQES